MIPPPKFINVDELIDFLPEKERLIVDVLRGIIRDKLPEYCKEKISFNVPYYYGNKGICIIWPSHIPRGGIKEGVLLGFWQGPHLSDPDQYLIKGTNKKVYYKIYKDFSELKLAPIEKLLDEAIILDKGFTK